MLEKWVYKYFSNIMAVNFSHKRNQRKPPPAISEWQTVFR